MTVHSETALRALTLLDPDEAKDIGPILARNPHAFVAGAPFPDYMYQCGTDHGAGEEAHWHTFHAAAATYLREKYPKWRDGDKQGEVLFSFMMGALSHYAADANWHGMRLKMDGKSRGFGLGFLQFLGETDFGCAGQLCGPGHSEGDTGGEFIIHHQLRSTSNIEPLHWVIPAADLVEIFHRDGHPNVTSAWIQECHVEFVAAVEGIAIAGEAIFPKFANIGPNLQEQFQDFWVGGFDDMAFATLMAWRKFVAWCEQGPPPVPPPLGSSVAQPRVQQLQRASYKKLFTAVDEALKEKPQILVQTSAGGVVETRAVRTLEQQRAVERGLGGTTPKTLEERMPSSWDEVGLYASRGFAALYCDIDGDGTPEQVWGAPSWGTPGSPLVGRVYVTKGGATMEIRPGTTDGGGEMSGARFGFSLACSDFDGDGIEDLAISAPAYDPDPIDYEFERQNYSGRVDIFYGTKDGLSKESGWAVAATGEGSMFGFTLHATTSENGALLVVGSPYWGRSNAEDLHAGRVHVFRPTKGLRSANPDRSALYTIDGQQLGEHFGYSICSDGDTIYVGAPHFRDWFQPLGKDGKNASMGALYGTRAGHVTGRVHSIERYSRFGLSCAPVSGGRIAVGMPGHLVEGHFGIKHVFSGAVVILAGSRVANGSTALTDEDLKEAWTHPRSFGQPPAYARFGWSLAASRDGETLVVGAPFGNREAGAVMVYHPLTGKPVMKELGSDSERLGWSVAIGADAILVGAPKNGAAMRGKVSEFKLPRGSKVAAAATLVI